MSQGFSGGSSQIAGVLGSASISDIATFSDTGVPEGAVRIVNTIWLITAHIGYELIILELDTATQSLLNEYECTIPGADSSQGIINGGDGYLYMGGGSTGNPIRFNLTTHVFEDLGHINNAQFYWDFCFGNDGNIYAGTSNQTRIVRIIPGAGTIADMGRADAAQTIARDVITGTGDLIYIGVGNTTAKIVAYDTALATFTDITPVGAPSATTARVWTGIDGNPYGRIGSQHYSLSGLVATPVGSSSPSDEIDSTLIDSNQIDVYDPNIPATYNMDLTGHTGGNISIFQLGAADGNLYGSGILPAYFFEREGGNINTLSLLGNGEVISFIELDSKLIMGAYACSSPIFIYDPRLPVSASNPLGVSYSGSLPTWRPRSACIGPLNYIYFGSLYGTASTQGPLIRMNPYNQTVQQFIVVPNQMPITVAKWSDLVLFGTTVKGDGFPSPPPQDPVLGYFNPSNETFGTIESFSGYAFLTSMVIYENTAVFIAIQDIGDLTIGDLIFYDLNQNSILRKVTLPWNYEIAHSNMILVGDSIFGVSDFGDLFEVDPTRYLVRRISSSAGSTLSRNVVNIQNDLFFQKGAAIRDLSEISGLSGWF